jgi:hypothetical protein
MGLYLAEALGYRVDEALPLVFGKLAAGAAKIAGKVGAAGAKALGKVGSKVGAKLGGMAKKKAVGMAKEKLAGRVQAGPEGVATGDATAQEGAALGQQAKSNKDLEEGKIMNSYVKALMEKAGRPLSPVQKRYENIPASDVAAAKPGRGGVDPQVQKDVGDEAKRTQAKVPGSDPDAAHLLAQKKARDAAAKAKGEKPTGDTRGHGTPNPIQPSRT